jgi:hypothetical protein
MEVHLHIHMLDIDLDERRVNILTHAPHGI